MIDTLLAVRNLCFQGCGPLSFSLSQGECIGIRGQSGVGKTQMFRALSDLIPSTGEVLLRGRARETFAAPRWRTLVSMLPTDSVWWYDDVAAHFNSSEARAFLDRMCGKVGLAAEIASWQVNRLSTGEKQRLALLRSLQIKPGILLLDEPTSALDDLSTKLVETLLLERCRDEGLSLMWVSHDEAQLARVSDRLFVMHKNQLTEVV